MRCNMSSRPTASFPCILATYFTSGLPIMCSYGLEDTTITHKSRPKNEKQYYNTFSRCPRVNNRRRFIHELWPMLFLFSNFVFYLESRSACTRTRTDKVPTILVTSGWQKKFRRKMAVVVGWLEPNDSNSAQWYVQYVLVFVAH